MFLVKPSKKYLFIALLRFYFLSTINNQQSTINNQQSVIKITTSYKNNYESSTTRISNVKIFITLARVLAKR